MDKNISILKYLYDVLASVKAIDIHLSSKRNYSDYIGNLTVQRAIERELKIIGEAINKLLIIANTALKDTAFSWRTRFNESVRDLMIGSLRVFVRLCIRTWRIRAEL